MGWVGEKEGRVVWLVVMRGRRGGVVVVVVVDRWIETEGVGGDMFGWLWVVGGR